MTIEPMPAALREAVSRDLGPVRPLHPPWRRTALVAGVAAAVIATVMLAPGHSLRQDLASLPLWLSWGASLLELAAGIAVIGLALREAVPGGAAPRGAVRTVALAAFALQLIIGVATWLYGPGTPPGPGWLTAGAGCLSHDAAMILPGFAVTLWLVFRALPLRAPAAGLLGGCGAALTRRRRDAPAVPGVGSRPRAGVAHRRGPRLRGARVVDRHALGSPSPREQRG